MITWTRLPKGTAWKASLECLSLCLIPITSAFVATNEEGKWYPIVLIALSLTVAAAARWSSNIERITGNINSILIVAATGRKGFEALSADDTLITLVLAGSCLLTAATLMTIVWDRQRKITPLRHLLLILDLDFARRYRQDVTESNGNSQYVTSQARENKQGHLLVRRKII